MVRIRLKGYCLPDDKIKEGSALRTLPCGDNVSKSQCFIVPMFTSSNVHGLMIEVSGNAGMV